MNKIIAALAFAVVTLVGPSAFAYTLPTEDVNGWVGKGEVQSAFELKNKDMQTYHGSVTFTYEATARYSQDCEKEVGGVKQTKTIFHTFSKSVDISATLADADRKTGQWTGWFLLAPLTTGVGTVPTDLCTPGVGEDGQSGWVPVDGAEVTLTEGSSTSTLSATIPGLGTRSLG